MAKLRNKGIRRSLSSAQLAQRMLVFSIDGTAGTPAATGFDRFQIQSVVDLGAGNYTIIFDNPFERDCMPVGHCVLTAARALQVTAVAYDRVTVQCTDLAGAPADADFNMQVIGSDGRFDH